MPNFRSSAGARGYAAGMQGSRGNAAARGGNRGGMFGSGAKPSGGSKPNYNMPSGLSARDRAGYAKMMAAKAAHSKALNNNNVAAGNRAIARSTTKTVTNAIESVVKNPVVDAVASLVGQSETVNALASTATGIVSQVGNVIGTVTGALGQLGINVGTGGTSQAGGNRPTGGNYGAGAPRPPVAPTAPNTGSKPVAPVQRPQLRNGNQFITDAMTKGYTRYSAFTMLLARR